MLRRPGQAEPWCLLLWPLVPASYSLNCQVPSGPVCWLLGCFCDGAANHESPHRPKKGLLNGPEA
jgi:hypothetical protein